MKWLKFTGLVTFLGAALILIQFWGLPALSNHALIEEKLLELGLLGPVIYVVGYAILIVLTAPGTVITLIGGAVFPLHIAFALVIIGAMIGATLSFFIARYLGRDAVNEVLGSEGRVGQWTSKINDLLTTRGLMAVAYLRMAYVPFVVLNYLAPLSGIRFRDFFWGTLLGILPGTFVFVFMGSAIRQAWQAGDLSELVSARSAVALTLFALSLALPWVLNRLKKWKGSRAD